MKAADFVGKAKKAAGLRTVYCKGFWGQLVTAQTVAEKQRQYPGWYTQKKVGELSAFYGFDCFGFDCVCLIKSILWGWDAEYAHRNGGADYKKDGIPDFGADALMEHCTGVSDDFSQIVPGEVVWMPGHCGIYIGDGLVVEATSKWAGCVQVTGIGGMGAAEHSRTWKKHGKLTFVDYEQPRLIEVSLPVLKKGAKLPQVRRLQTLLNACGCNPPLEVDGSFGAKTDAALRWYQRSCDLEADGSCGRKTWNMILGNTEETEE